MRPLLEFGEQIDGYAVRVVNERAVRAAAGLLMVPAFVSFMQAMLLGNFQPTRLFVVIFLLDMATRLFVNPRLSPSMILGQWFVRQQRPEWVGAAQKRFAWGLGLLLAIAMFFLMVVNQVMGPINMLVCGTCLVLMFFEVCFGICLGCKLYAIFYRTPAQLCPGDSCELPQSTHSGIQRAQWLTLVAFVGATALTSQWVQRTGAPTQDRMTSAREIPAETDTPLAAREMERCQVPAFAKAIGHEAQWKLHNGCP
ncbi:MAG: DUF4395 domain-containing protein [Rhodoferax sp.]|nr:DUF4395 domain-containing protein [Rhodoferax sp.]